MSPGDAPFQIHIVRGDGTNSAAAQQSKVHFAMSISSYCAGLEFDDPDAPQQSVRSCVADLQFLPTSCTGKDLFEIYKVQMRSMGLPAFEGPIPSDNVRVIVFVTDDGPDQKGAQKLMASALHEYASTFFFRFKCILHQLHLIVGKQLKRLDGHYSQIAKVVNVWRSTGNAWKIFQKYTQMFGEQRSREVAKRLPPRPLKGRWGSISAVEQYLLQCGPDELPVVYASAIGTLTDEAEGDALVELGSDQIFDMDASTYRGLMGKWRRDAISALRSNSLWLQLCISFGTRQPLDHLMRWLMQPPEQGGAESYQQGKLPDLVYHKLDAVMAEFSEVLRADSPQWSLFRKLCEKEGDQSGWVALLVASTLEQASEMNRRVVEYFGDFPARLAWFVFQKPEVECAVRKALAAELLALPDEDLDPSFSLKFRAFYKYDLEVCCNSGMISLGMHRMLSDLCRHS